MLQKELGCSVEKERRTSLEEEDRLGVVTRVQGRTRGAGEGRDHQWVEETSEDRRGRLSCETRRRLSSTEKNTGRDWCPAEKDGATDGEGDSDEDWQQFVVCQTLLRVLDKRRRRRASPAPGLKGDSLPEQGKHGGRWLCGRGSMLTSGQERKQSKC